MSRKKSRIMGQDAFRKAFVEAEMIMRVNIANMIMDEIKKQTNDDIITGLGMARKIVIGEEVK